MNRNKIINIFLKVAKILSNGKLKFNLFLNLSNVLKYHYYCYDREVNFLSIKVKDIKSL